MSEARKVYVVFDGPPSHESGRFVECETEQGNSLNAGAWFKREDGFWTLGPFVTWADHVAALKQVQASDDDDEELCDHPTIYHRDGECSICHKRVGA